MTKQEKLIEELKRLIQEYDRDTSYADEFARNYRQIPTIEAEPIRQGGLNMRLIDADVLEREGWVMHRTYQSDAHTMTYEVKHPSDFPAIDAEPVRHGKWIMPRHDSRPLCSECGKFGDERTDYCPNCGAKMENGD